MAIGETCKICSEAPSKYKCPNCSLDYCSLKCFKSESHKHDEIPTEKESTTETVDNKVIKAENTQDEFDKLIKDEKLQYLLKFKALKFHLKAIYEILNDTSLNRDEKWDQANQKLSNLRITGSEENELVEEFCQRVVELQSDS